MRRKKPVSPEALERMRAADLESIWAGRCVHCGEEFEGTPNQIEKQVRGHTCVIKGAA